MKRLLALQTLSNFAAKLPVFLEKAFETEKDKLSAIIAHLAHQLLFLVKQKAPSDPHGQRAYTWNYLWPPGTLTRY